MGSKTLKKTIRFRSIYSSRGTATTTRAKHICGAQLLLHEIFDLASLLTKEERKPHEQKGPQLKNYIHQRGLYGTPFSLLSTWVVKSRAPDLYSLRVPTYYINKKSSSFAFIGLLR